MLIDTGSGSAGVDRADPRVPGEHGCADDLAWLALTHFHADHAGGAAALGVPVAAHAIEADWSTTATRAPAIRGSASTIPPYRVTRALRDGDRLEGLEVVHTPGQTPGHVAYWLPSERVAITGDLLQHGDVAWVPFGGPWAAGALDRDDRVDPSGSPRWTRALTIPGHGPPVERRPGRGRRHPRALRALPRATRRARPGTRRAARSSRT